MNYRYEQLAKQFASIPVTVYGVFQTVLESNHIYTGHVDKPTTKCGMIIGLRGEAEFIFDGTERYRVSPGTVLLGGAGRQLEILVGDSGFEYCLVHYLLDQDDMDKHAVAYLTVTLEPELIRLLEQIVKAASEPDYMGQLEKKALFYRIVTFVIQSDRREQIGESYPVVEDAIAYIQAHYMEGLTLAGLSERYQLKPKYFSYLFQKYTGTAPIDYLIAYRMNRAQEWLTTGQFSVSAVARSVGYADPYYFSRLFKKYKGVPPSKLGFAARRNCPS
ncbi:AraC family transcriptional regulator [Paenibacillus soyae]|uniref:AraC family transcriptional regulator n=1 Tax=Paenibacillus soyae TaxID=2969249 RepID=A0A9X2SA08_9BACL|nr:AraC family transcriptional regulator [Paenibacillus soyae]MCR2806044.1 AraC family transcriptional regulator [Paenibacillus soyae]